MRSQEITIHVEPGAADAYRSTSEEERRKLDLLLSLKLSEATESRRPLKDVLREKPIGKAWSWVNHSSYGPAMYAWTGAIS